MVMAGDRVQHRAWLTYGSITDVPDELTHLSSVSVLWDSKEGVRQEWMPSLITDTDDFIYDWGDVRDKVKKRSKGKSKKR